MAHFVMDGEGVHPVAPIRSTRGRKSFKKSLWIDGAPVGFDVPQPIVFELDPDSPGNPKVLYSDEPVPAMRLDLLECLLHVGVKNLELFDAVLLDTETGKEYKDYKAFNIVGRVSAADLERSSRMGVSDRSTISADFDSLVIDESKAGGLLLFRLAENLSAIVVDEKIKNEVERRKIPGLFFYASGEWSG